MIITVAFKLKTGKTINKVLAGAGIVALGSLVLGAIAPNMLGSTTGRILEGAAAYGVGGIESLAGAAVTMFIAPRASGATALDNTLTQSL